MDARQGSVTSLRHGAAAGAVVLLSIMLMAVACTSGIPETSAPAITAAPAPTYTPLPTYTPYPTYTLVPTATPEPTATPTPEAPAPTPAPTPTPNARETDRTALIALYDATNGPSWANNANWASEAPLRQWHGVTTDADGRVIELSLQENGLRGELPPELGDLSALVNLRLWSNELTGEIPPELARLTQLEQFAVGGNRLRGTIPEWFADFHNLRELHLPTNRFTGPLPRWLGDLPLRRLILGNNRFDGDIPEEFGNLRNLRALWLGGNDLTGCIPDVLREVRDNDFAASGLPVCSAIAQAVTPMPTKTPTNTPTPLPTTAPTQQPRVEGVKYIDDPEVPYLKWEIGPEVPEDYERDLQEGVHLIVRYLESLGARELTRDVTYYLFQEPSAAYAGFARLKGMSVKQAQRHMDDRKVFGEAGDGFVYLNLDRLPIYFRPYARRIEFSAHEMAHVYQWGLGNLGAVDLDHSKVRANGPAWLVEGEATFVAARMMNWAGIVSYREERRRFENRALARTEDLEEFETYTKLRFTPGTYELGALAVELLASLVGEEALVVYWTALGPGIPWQEAFETTFGMTIDEFYPLFEEHRADGFPNLDLPDIAPRIPLAAADRKALTALYDSAGGVYWANNGNWLSDEPGNQWHGMTTDRDGYVTVLDLSENRLSGELPAELGNLSRLRELILDNNQLTGGIPPELGNLANLEGLHLVRNRLSGPIPPELGSLTSLKELRIWGNELKGEIPSTLADLSELTHFSAGGNELTGEIPSWLGDLPHLRSLHLSENQLTGPIPDNLAKLTNVSYFNVNRNRLTGNIPSWLSDFPLRQLYLNDNQLTGEIPNGLSDLPDLEWLWLGGNSLSGCVPSALRVIPNNDLDRVGLPDC